MGAPPGTMQPPTNKKSIRVQNWTVLQLLFYSKDIRKKYKPNWNRLVTYRFFELVEGLVAFKMAWIMLRWENFSCLASSSYMM